MSIFISESNLTLKPLSSNPWSPPKRRPWPPDSPVSFRQETRRLSDTRVLVCTDGPRCLKPTLLQSQKLLVSSRASRCMQMRCTEYLKSGPFPIVSNYIPPRSLLLHRDHPILASNAKQSRPLQINARANRVSHSVISVARVTLNLRSAYIPVEEGAKDISTTRLLFLQPWRIVKAGLEPISRLTLID